ncbi:hypothetical protein CCAX7_54770 [Capsulimonas corticalis]|uniref:Uncharacterized protein n=1 Tax=Capsulimonas corticalis TaxID=2219043 RepID=A0A402D5V4_9BACT|nr:hypothetical protein [Capsulimonas corticalis]BDI33426.1 hypothetical protein CCAX7_54770 [Capsulimonas corticalis]
MCKCTPGIRTPFCGKPGCTWTDDPEEVDPKSLAAEKADFLRAEMQKIITVARDCKSTGLLYNRELSEAITCAETAYLWLEQLPGGSKSLEFGG